MLQHCSTRKNSPKCVWSRAGMSDRAMYDGNELGVQTSVHGDGFTVDVGGV